MWCWGRCFSKPHQLGGLVDTARLCSARVGKAALSRAHVARGRHPCHVMRPCTAGAARPTRQTAGCGAGGGVATRSGGGPWPPRLAFDRTLHGGRGPPYETNCGLVRGAGWRHAPGAARGRRLRRLMGPCTAGAARPTRQTAGGAMSRPVAAGFGFGAQPDLQRRARPALREANRG